VKFGNPRLDHLRRDFDFGRAIPFRGGFFYIMCHVGTYRLAPQQYAPTLCRVKRECRMTSTLNVTVGETPIPIFAATITGGAHGSTGHANFRTSRAMLASQGIDLLTLAEQAPDILQTDIYAITDAGGPFHLFSGEYLKAKWNFRTDVVTIFARDWSGLLIDQKRVLTSILGGNPAVLAPGQQPGAGVSTTNQPLSALVTAIANQFGLTPDLRLAQGAGNDPEIGTIFGSSNDTILMTVPQSLWGILMRLARDTGNEVYTTPEKHLVFGVPGAGLPTLTLGWKQNPPAPGVLPLLDLGIEHNPRRNLTFRVLVLSYDPTLGKTTRGQAYVIGSNFNTTGGSQVRAGMWTGAQAQAIQAQIGTAKKSAMPLYTFHVDGLTQAQANLRAQSIATDIAKRELIGTAKADLIPDLSPSQPIRLDGAVDAGFLAHSYYVTGYSHTFMLPQDAAGGDGGELDTDLTFLDVQPVGEGNSTLTGTAE
jgi:hypothetical protein